MYQDHLPALSEDQNDIAGIHVFRNAALWLRGLTYREIAEFI